MKSALALSLVIIALFAFGCTLPGGGVICDETNSPVCGSDGVTYKNLCYAQKAGVTAMSSGSCEKCADTDNGKNVLQRGTLTVANQTKADACVTDTKILEYYCTSDGGWNMSELSCPADYICKEGACAIPQCTDSDNGADVFTNGTTVKSNVTKTDHCFDANHAIKYHCENNEIKEATVSCPAGYACENGACLESCTSTVNGTGVTYDIYTNDTVTKGGSSSVDYCFNSQKVVDYYCTSSGTVASQTTVCSPGFTCENGACRSNSCSDSDVRDIYTAGKVFVHELEYADACISDTEIKEYYCDENRMQTFTTTCPNNYACVKGACVNSTHNCYDTDNGQDPYTRGEVHYQFPPGYYTTYRDVCDDTRYVKEYYCTDADAPDYKSLECPANFACTDGRCIYSTSGTTSSCTDSDGGIDAYVYGSVGYNGNFYYDECSGPTFVKEGYCNNGIYTTTTIACNSNYLCQNGRCVLS